MDLNRSHTDGKSLPPRPASDTLSPPKGTVNSSELHPNQAVIIDEAGERKLVEIKLVIHDEMIDYLNKVADHQNDDVSTMIPTPQSTNVLSPSAIMPSPGTLNQVMPSPSGLMIQMIRPSPAPNYGQLIPSPSLNFGAIQNPMLSSAPSMNQMAPSPASNMIPTIPSPMFVRYQSQLMPPGTNVMQHNQLMQLHNNQILQQTINYGMSYDQHGVTWDSKNIQYYNPYVMTPQHGHAQNATNTMASTPVPHNQMCSPNGYVPNECPSNKPMDTYSYYTNVYPPIQSPAYNYYNSMSNMNQPLPSPAVATHVPTEMMYQPQQPQMGHPFAYYNNQGYYQLAYNQCMPNNEPNNDPNNVPNNEPNNAQSQRKSTNKRQSKNSNQTKKQTRTKKNNESGTGNASVQPQGMDQDTYQRVLEYVQNCQSWVPNSDVVSSSTHALAKCETTSSNVAAGDKTSPPSSLPSQENK